MSGMMTEYGALGKQFQEYLNGNYYPDGRKTPWRIEQEERRAEEMGKRVFVPKIERTRSDRPKVARVYSDRHREMVCNSIKRRKERLKAEGICVDCQRQKVKEGRTSCADCLKKRYERQKLKKEALRRAA